MCIAVHTALVPLCFHWRLSMRPESFLIWEAVFKVLFGVEISTAVFSVVLKMAEALHAETQNVEPSTSESGWKHSLIHFWLPHCFRSTSSPLKLSVAMASSSAPYRPEALTTATKTGMSALVLFGCLELLFLHVVLIKLSHLNGSAQTLLQVSVHLLD